MIQCTIKQCSTLSENIYEIINNVMSASIYYFNSNTNILYKALKNNGYTWLDKFVKQFMVSKMICDVRKGKAVLYCGFDYCRFHALPLGNFGSRVRI